MKNNQGLAIAVGIIGLLTLINSYKIFFGNDSNGRTIDPIVNNQPTNTNGIQDNGTNFPNPLPNQNENPNNNLIQAPESNLPKTNITFEKSEHNFGTILQNSENKHSFTFRNTGVEPLIISNAKGSCGCTVPNYPKEPVAPGATATIDVVYSPGMQSGTQSKTVTLTANTEPVQTILTIGATVNPDPNAPKQPEGGQASPISIMPGQ